MSHLLLWINLIFVEEMCGNVFVIFLSWNVNDLSLEIFSEGNFASYSAFKSAVTEKRDWNFGMR